MNRSIEGIKKERLVVQEVEFEQALSSALKNYPFIKTVRQFQVPTEHGARVDFYISSPIRIFIEIKSFGKSVKVEHLRRINAQMEATSNLFNNSVVPLLVLITPKPLTSTKKLEVLNDEIITLFCPIQTLGRGSIEQAAGKCAHRIRNLIAHPFTTITGHRNIDLVKELSSKRKEPDWSISKNQQKIVYSDELKLLQSKDEIFDTEFEDFIGSFKSALDAETYHEFKQEFIQFDKEYKSKHYTSAALRLGRILERAIYNLLNYWGITVNRQTTEVLTKMQTSVNDLKKQVINYTTANDQEKPKFRELVGEKVKEVNTRTLNLVIDLDKEQEDPKTSDSVPSPNALIRDLKKKYGRNEKIRNEIDKILKEDIIDKIYKVRLDAAHADIAGKTREVSLKELDKAMRLLKILFFRLANILVHVNREREKEGDC